jgi:hypothetical protein
VTLPSSPYKGLTIIVIVADAVVVTLPIIKIKILVPQCQGFSGSHTRRCKEHKIGLELDVRAFEQDLTYLLFAYCFFVTYSRFWQPYFEPKFTGANLYIIIFKGICGSYDKVS